MEILNAVIIYTVAEGLLAFGMVLAIFGILHYKKRR